MARVTTIVSCDCGTRWIGQLQELGSRAKKKRQAWSVKWIPYNKGGEFRKWSGNNQYLVNWEDNGKEIIEYATALYESRTRTIKRPLIKNIPYYYRQCITWSFVSSAYFGVRYSDCGFIFDVGGSSAFQGQTDSESAIANGIPVFQAGSLRS